MNKTVKKQGKIGVLTRILKMLIQAYPVLLPITVLCIVISAVTAAAPAIFQQQVISDIQQWYLTGDWESAAKAILPKVAILAALYVFSAIAVTAQTQLMAYITQGFLNKLRCKMFDGMQNLPIKYFDTTTHGDIMSYYTNDIDTLRQLVAQSFPALLQASIIIVTVLGIMLYYSLWMTLVVLLGVVAMTFISKKVGGGSAKYFIRQQKSLGKAEGFIQEMMNGQKVVKVF